MKQYQPLYLKYRPQKLSEVIGQEVVTKTLSNAILYNKTVHAYLFCGPRGTGKTSTARILAKSLNCESGITVEPCNKCVSCRSITDGNSLDVIEIDAASHRKVEDAEDLINRVNLGTYGSRFKIYIIDEVHMLTDHAFNALLKTLEEPPKNVIFILATTEEYKVIPTIISRCQKLDFKPVRQKDLEERIKEIAKSEKINIDQNIVNFISKRSSGCLRDAVSLLDQISVLQIEDKPISQKEVFELFGTVDRNSLFKLVEAILQFDKKNTIDLGEELVKSGKDISELFKNLLELIIDLGKAKIDTDYKKTLSNELSNDLKVLDKTQQNHILKIIDRLHDTQARLRFALSQELEFMTLVMSMIDEDFLVSVSELEKRLGKLEAERQRSREAERQRSREAEKQRSREAENNNEQLATSDELEPQALQASAPTHPGTYTPNDLDTLWSKIVSLIESNPTKTLLTQSESYLLNLTNDVLEIGISKDMFLPRLERDEKKKEMILHAVKLANSLEPKIIKFRVMPKAKEERSREPASILNPQSSEEDEFSKVVKDLLGARKVE